RLPTTPGHTVCGTIFTPNTKSVRKAAANKKGQLPLIMCPAGHFPDARFNPDLMERYTTLARMGFICVSYDLWGWGESEKEVGRAAHETAEAHVMQSLNGVKILDFMMERKDVDPERIGCNGGSGGGSQVVVLINIDPRYTAACPTVSMSSWFDGGCPCESGKAIHQSGGGTCNMELAAMFAPKPMMVVSDGGDWTSTTPELEYPFLQRIYSFYNAKGQVHNTHLPNERHDFGPNKRQAVYDFFRKLWLEQKD
ncbi:MAG: prolyl oligopeptidase family serine peptidase, partial [Bacteroidaceae bacterium]|nr:prolyl oligopeptidase family serine peptidase [Bacteroidaceae bacterium]